MNPDGNRGDDKYHKKKRGFVPSYVPKTGQMNKMKSWFSTKRTLVLVLLCCALMVQCYFIWLLFIRDNVDEGQSGPISRDEVMKKLFPEDDLEDLLGNQAKVKDLRDRVMQ